MILPDHVFVTPLFSWGPLVRSMHFSIGTWMLQCCTSVVQPLLSKLFGGQARRTSLTGLTRVERPTIPGRSLAH